jgi:hypothetical protein
MQENKNTSRRLFIKQTVGATAALSLPGWVAASPLLLNHQHRRAAPSGGKELVIDFNFENGNLGTYKIEGNTISIGPVSRHKDTWFSFTIKGVKHKKITMVIEWTNKTRVSSNFDGQGNNTAMITYDGNGFEIVKDVKFELKDPGNNAGNFIQTIHHTFREDEAHVTYCAPWSNTHMAELSQKLKSDPRVTIGSIGFSKFKNLPMTYYRITDKTVATSDKKKLFLVGREDSYESGGSWAIEGIINFILSDDPVAKEMLKTMEFLIVPIFSVDGVAMGATNFPLKPDNSTFVYVTSDWDREEPYHEVRLMQNFWKKMKDEGFHPDICFKFHATCYWQSHFRPEDCAPENLAKERELLKILRDKLSWRIEDPPLRGPEGYMNYNFIKVFPDAITYSSHSDFIFTRGYLKKDKNVYRRHEDILQDGELIARSYADFYGIASTEVAPYLMAGDVDRNAGPKGTSITYSVYYYDINGLPPQKVEVVINKKSYEMKAESTADFSKPVKFTFETVLKDSRNDFSFKASNGKKSRTVPEQNYQLPGPFVINA